ncbi:MAG: M20/M25/M40 family metallo-hydrolase [Clostridia bacterium]|nr:M20/M25/M40 family metallo-hydrolase [Clostridia bacterium]
MKAFDYFLELNKIPRGSGDETGVVNYLVMKALKFNLKYEVDKINNVKIFKNNNSDKTIILQAHTDMVCEKLKDVDFDFKKDAIKTKIEGDFISAQGTTLGADDGFGVALILEMLENCGEGYPNIEAVFTSQEESGMDGAKELDCNDLKGRHLIGLDGTSSSELIVGCAGSLRASIEKNFSLANGEFDKNLNIFSLDVYGLLGGHSGDDINKNRANANMVGFKILKQIYDVYPLKICKLISNGKLNAIAREFSVIFQSELELSKIEELISAFKIEFNKQYENEKFATFNLALSDYIDEENETLSYKETSVLIDFVDGFKNGVLEVDEQGNVITSVNFGNIEQVEKCIDLNMIYRFNHKKVWHISEQFTKYPEEKGFDFVIRGVSPHFSSGNSKELQDVCVSAYNESGFTGLVVNDIHAGLEGGIFAEKIRDLQVVVLGADLFDIHSPNERMRISSLDKLSVWIKTILKKFNEK